MPNHGLEFHKRQDKTESLINFRLETETGQGLSPISVANAHGIQYIWNRTDKTSWGLS